MTTKQNTKHYIFLEGLESQIGWIFKSKANESYCLYNSGPMVPHYALMYGFHTLPNMFQHIRERMEAMR